MNKLRRTFVCILCACLISCLAACGGRKGPGSVAEPTPTPGPSASAAYVEKSWSVPITPSVAVVEDDRFVPDGKFETVEDLMGDPSAADEFGAVAGTFGEQSGFRVMVSGTDNTLRYDVYLTDEAYVMGEDAILAVIGALMDSAEAELQDVADGLAGRVSTEEASLSIAFYGPDGNELASRSYDGYVG